MIRLNLLLKLDYMIRLNLLNFKLLLKLKVLDNISL